MSDVTVNINGHETVSPAAKAAGEAVQGLSDQTKGLSENMGTAQTKSEGFIRSFTDIKSMADMAIGVVKTVGRVVSDLADEYATQEKATVLFSTAMGMSGKITAEQAADLQAYSRQVQDLTGADEEETLALMRMLSTSGRSYEEIKALIAAAVDLSAATGDSLNTTAEQLNKTFSGSAGRLGMLIPELKGLSEEALAHGDAIAVVAEKYSGLSAQMDDLASTKIANAKNAFSDAKAALGGLLMEVFGPQLSQFTKEINQLADAIVGIREKINHAKLLKEALAAEKAGKATAEQKALISAEQVTDAEKKILEVKNALDLLAYTQTTKMALVGQTYTDELSRLNNELSVAMATYKTLTGKAYVAVPAHATGTAGAKRGPAVVGEKGPELIFMQGGETVIPNHMLRGLPGYAGGAGIGGFLDSAAASATASAVGQLMSSLSGFASSLGSIQAILNPISTMLQGMFEVIGPLINEALAPLVGVLKTVGMVMGKLLAPVITFLGGIIQKVAEFMIKIINGVIDMINWVLPKKWEIDRVNLAGVTKAGETSSPYTGGTTGASASYSKQRDVTVYLKVETAALVGEGGLRDFALIVKQEILSAVVLGIA